MEITKELLSKSKLLKGSSTRDGYVEYYYQSDTIEFYMWEYEGVFVSSLLWEGYESEVSLHFEDWETLSLVFKLVTKVDLLWK